MNLIRAVEPSAFRSMLIRLTITAAVLGVAGAVVALFLGSPFGALGVTLGVTIGFLNVRSIDRQISRTDVDLEASSKALRRMVGSRTLLRLGAITAVVLAIVVIEAPLGIGIVVGLVIFQFAFVGNVIRALTAQGGVA
jgi:hypothetical protein